MSKFRSPYTLSHSAFDTLTADALYWCGMLMADGCVYKERYGMRIFLTLHASDAEHLHSFRRFLQSDGPVLHQKDGSSRVSFYSARISDKLISLGITPRKSLTAVASSQLIASRDFWRGLVDGDGCLRIRSDGFASLYMLGSEPLMEQFAQFIRTICSKWKGRSLRYSKSSNCFRVVLSGSTARIVSHHLYKNSCIALGRKLAISEAMT